MNWDDAPIEDVQLVSVIYTERGKLFKRVCAGYVDGIYQVPLDVPGTKTKIGYWVTDERYDELKLLNRSNWTY